MGSICGFKLESGSTKQGFELKSVGNEEGLQQVRPHDLHKRAFTLVEVIAVTVVVAVLAVLVTIGAIRGVRSARNTACLSNLKSIYQSIHLYTNDHDGNFPPYPLIPHDPWTPKPREFKVALQSYGATDPIFYCPLDEKARTVQRGEWGSFEHMSYVTSLETVFTATTYKDGSYHFSLASVKEPSAFMLLLDQTIILADEQGRRSRVSSHGERLNVIYGDGHAKSVPVPAP